MQRKRKADEPKTHKHMAVGLQKRTIHMHSYWWAKGKGKRHTRARASLRRNTLHIKEGFYDYERDGTSCNVRTYIHTIQTITIHMHNMHTCEPHTQHTRHTCARARARTHTERTQLTQHGTHADERMERIRRGAPLVVRAEIAAQQTQRQPFLPLDIRARPSQRAATNERAPLYYYSNWSALALYLLAVLRTHRVAYTERIRLCVWCVYYNCILFHLFFCFLLHVNGKCAWTFWINRWNWLCVAVGLALYDQPLQMRVCVTVDCHQVDCVRSPECSICRCSTVVRIPLAIAWCDVSMSHLFYCRRFSGFCFAKTTLPHLYVCLRHQCTGDGRTSTTHMRQWHALRVFVCFWRVIVAFAFCHFG